MSRILILCTVLSAFVASACGGGPDGEVAETTPVLAETGGASWPEQLITGPGSGPALYLDSSAEAPAIGYVSPGLRVQLGETEGDRVMIRIRGALKVRAWITRSRLAARVQRRGRVRGTPTSVGVNDLVRIMGTSDEGLLRVEVRPDLGRGDLFLGPFVGEYPADRLAAEAVDAEAEATEGDWFRLPAGQEVRVYDRPRGEVVATLPAIEPPLAVQVVRARGEWKAVRAGVGPFLAGYVDADLEAMEGAPGVVSGGAQAAGSIPRRLQAEPDRPLWRLETGTRVRFDGRTVAILGEAGWAREMGRYDETGEADVFVAVNDEIAVRGMVRIGDLQEVPAEPAADAPAAE